MKKSLPNENNSLKNEAEKILIEKLTQLFRVGLNKKPGNWAQYVRLLINSIQKLKKTIENNGTISTKNNNEMLNGFLDYCSQIGLKINSKGKIVDTKSQEIMLSQEDETLIKDIATLCIQPLKFSGYEAFKTNSLSSDKDNLIVDACQSILRTIKFQNNEIKFNIPFRLENEEEEEEEEEVEGKLKAYSITVFQPNPKSSNGSSSMKQIDKIINDIRDNKKGVKSSKKTSMLTKKIVEYITKNDRESLNYALSRCENAGININNLKSHNSKDTLLHIACANNKVSKDIIKMLLKYGAFVDVPNDANLLPIELALSNNQSAETIRSLCEITPSPFCPKLEFLRTLVHSKLWSTREVIFVHYSSGEPHCEKDEYKCSKTQDSTIENLSVLFEYMPIRIGALERFIYLTTKKTTNGFRETTHETQKHLINIPQIKEGRAKYLYKKLARNGATPEELNESKNYENELCDHLIEDAGKISIVKRIKLLEDAILPGSKNRRQSQLSQVFNNRENKGLLAFFKDTKIVGNIKSQIKFLQGNLSLGRGAKP